MRNLPPEYLLLLCFCRHQLEVPGRYQQLQAFYEDKKATLEGIPASMSTNSLASTPGSELLPEMKVGVFINLMFLK